jgi:hypothetical protein
MADPILPALVCAAVLAARPDPHRVYPKADQGVEPDAGWAGDPTEGNGDLVRIARRRLHFNRGL